jgi:hypothetical protein
VSFVSLYNPSAGNIRREKKVGGAETDSTNSQTHTTNGTNEKSPTCFENEKSAVKQEGGDSQKTNKGNSVSSVSSVSGEAPAALTVADALQVLEDPNTGAYKNALLYSAHETGLEYLVRSVLFARGIPTEEWQSHARAVEEAFEDWRRRAL